jgi:hypothetical protein
MERLARMLGIAKGLMCENGLKALHGYRTRPVV